MIDLGSIFQFLLSIFHSKVFLVLQITGGVISFILLVIIVVLVEKGGAFTRHVRHLWIAWNKSVLPKHRMRRLWSRILKVMESGNPSEWREAVLFADQMLDEILQRIGYEGTTMEERLSNINTTLQFPALEDARRARKIRNFLVENPDYPLAREVAEQTIEVYKKIFIDVGVAL